MKSNWTSKTKTELVLRILAGEQTILEAAERYGLDATTIESWRDLYVNGLRHAAKSTKPSVFKALGKHPFTAVGTVLAALLVIGVSIEAISETPTGCADHQLSNTNLCQFNAGEPAVANEVNSNFSKLKLWLEQKVGAVGSSNIATSNIDATGQISGNISTTEISLPDGEGSLSITGDEDTVIASFNQDVDAGVETGLAVGGNLSVDGKMTVGGALDWSHNEDGAYPILPDNFCIAIPANQSCPVGWNARLVKWDTEDDSNADVKDGVIAWDCASSSSVCMMFCCRGNDS